MITANETRVRLLIITPTLESGGSEKIVSLVCNHINTDLFSVCLVVVNNSNPFFKIQNPAVKVISLKKKRVLFSLPAIKTAVKNFKPHIIFSTANHLNLYLAVFRNHFNPAVKFIAREANIVSINSKEARMPLLYNRLIKMYYNRFDHIICQSVYMRQDLEKHYHIPLHKTTVIPNAVQEVSARQFPQQKNKPEGHTYKFITVARLSQQKGIERLIHAVGLLSVSFNYYIIGKGNKREALQKLIDELQLQEKVFLSGEKEHPFAGMEDSDLFLMGSYYEGFPNALLEAGAHGIPVVAFDAPGGIAEIITDNENGLLVDDNDIIAFAEAINKALEHNFNRDQITEATKNRFSVNSMMTAMENIFIELAPDK